MPDRRRITILIAGACAVIAVAFLIRTAVTPPPVSAAVSHTPSTLGADSEQNPETRARMIAERDAQLRASPKLVAGETDARQIRRVLDEASHAPIDLPRALTPAARGALLDTLASYTTAWLAPDAEAYLAIAESEGTSWRPPDDRCWTIADKMLTHHGESPAEPEHPAETARRLLNLHRFNDANRWTAVATGDDAVLVLTTYARATEEIAASPLMDGPMTEPGTRSHWFWVRGHQLRLREPPISAEDVLKRDGGMFVALSNITFFDASGAPSIWGAFWYWDPSARVWHNSMSVGYGPHDSNRMFY